MFGLLRTRPPLDAREKAWVETRMHLLADRLGYEQLLAAKTILPTDEYFPSSSQSDPASQQRLLERVCDYYPDLPRDVVLSVSPTEPARTGGGCGTGGCGAPTGQHDPLALVAAGTHQLSRSLLIQRGRVDAEDPDLDRLAELATVYFGFGIFSANMATQRRLLPARMLAYSLALFAWVRDESTPTWSRYLQPDSAAPFRASLRFLRKTKDSLFQASTARSQYAANSVNELLAQLQNGTSSAKIAALWELAGKTDYAGAALPAIQQCLGSRMADIRAEAANTLGALGAGASPAVEQLTDALHDPQERVRAAAAMALGRLLPQSETVVQELADNVLDDDPTVVHAAAWALGHFGARAEVAMPQLLRAMRTALVECHDPRAAHLLDTVRAIVPDPESSVLGFFDEHDADLRHSVLVLLEQHDS